MSWISDVLIYFGNDSKLKEIIKASIIFGTTDFIPEATKMGDQSIWI
jgi:hypothetical protein